MSGGGEPTNVNDVGCPVKQAKIIGAGHDRFQYDSRDLGACVFPENGANNHCDGRPEITSFRKITIPIAENR